MSDSTAHPKPWKEWRGSARYGWKQPFFWTEWACEHLAFRLRRWAFIEVLEYLGKLSLLGGLIAFIWGIPARQRAAEDARKSKHYQAWQTINSALGQSGNGGRNDALQDLNKDRISMAGVDISGAFLMDLELPFAYMQFARMTNVTFVRPNFTSSYLWHVNFRNSYFEDSIFSRAYLYEANFSEARFIRGSLSDSFLFKANFSNAYLPGVTFAKANLGMANLTDALLEGADLTDAHLVGAIINRADFTMANLFNVNFEQATMDGADFENAYLSEANFSGVTNWPSIVNLKQANIYKLSNPPLGFFEWATNKMGAVVIPVTSYRDWTNRLRQRK